MPVTKAVIPAAGLGTRFLPATKAVPKEMLPVVDRPAIEYVVEEASRAGLRDVLLITSRSKKAVEDHFDRDGELEQALERKKDEARLGRVRASAELGAVHSVRQGAPRGLGHAVLCGAAHVGDEPFAVLLGDDLIDERDPLLPEMLDVQARFGGSVIALMEVPEEMVSMYGVATVDPEPVLAGRRYQTVRIRDLVEKPPVDEAPSNLAIIGRYVLSPAVFDVLRRTQPGRGGEIQLTDALRELAQAGDEAGQPVHGVIFTGRRYDTGDRIDYLKAVIRLACERPDLGPELYPWLEEYVASGGPKADG
ncbi:UTP--glucose-1-phosphate uridylyltransferase GalU [Frankia sp. CNm7]|uniref:UTP--glucose-1-phosphate uridylyltransferase n=1 Tax=Frankia nepalensis TaxID=1836974 RepID=A0A937US32_9ACTN|nr:UTP--glucose-1-phosphate uridylyltransferase GalU [Frankia nepalensis]MBL7494792.1 UTP--glucose-1-phosphate uridylyltransferase GalU [Frankia nepalensis]MBL7514334.1 UTP--glucose-1-phosphate uridylyltransferase GalU [Frankia nepalensis]MBL7517249.1 UTP--glucose-1-phosphate uridylyltransferase GalU [Frankia nepalensis]MBL7631738.1 UTP--glucose-1-phosphate uridylyltransferase GalU [Frankia nepalensis]